jgi:ketosteroid isomerase-like protein
MTATERPAERSTERPAERSAERPAERSTERPAERSTERPAERPTEPPIAPATAPAVTPFLAALATGDLDAVASAVAPDILAALPTPGSETAARAISTDRAGLLAGLKVAFGEPATMTAHVDVQVARGTDDVLLEGHLSTTQAPAPTATWLASLQIVDGAIARLLVFTCPPVEPSRTWTIEMATPGDARAVVDRYFEHLDRGEFQAAVECFSADALYSHPPYQAGAPRAEFRGHAELLSGFERRGVKPDRTHRIDVAVQHGPDYLLEGCTTDGSGSRTFMSSVALDSRGLIQRYVAVASASMVPRIEPGT